MAQYTGHSLTLADENLMECYATHLSLWRAAIYETVGIMGRTSSAPISAHRLIVDKVQEIQSGILTYNSLVLLQINVV